MDDVNNKVVDTIIVKDLSRLGKDHVMTGYYVESYFPANNIRFISVGDGLDSFNMNNSNDSFTFVIACNDYYSKHYSMKIRDMLRQKQLQGKYTGSKPPYGYMKDPNDKGHLIPDPITAPVARKIFELAVKEYSNMEIANYLNENNIVAPGYYCSPKVFTNKLWNISSVKNILSNKLYTGDMIQHITQNVSYKCSKRVPVPKKDWIIVENTHEALVSKGDFNFLIKLSAKGRSKNYSCLLDKLIYCDNCGEDIYIHIKSNSGYCRNCHNRCFSYTKLENKILSILIDKKIITTKKISRKELFHLIDKIFIGKDKNFKIIFNKNIDMISFKY